jgi:hypothetical protein
MQYMPSEYFLSSLVSSKEVSSMCIVHYIYDVQYTCSMLKNCDIHILYGLCGVQRGVWFSEISENLRIFFRMPNIKIFSGSSHPDLTQKICDRKPRLVSSHRIAHGKFQSLGHNSPQTISV